MRNIATALTVAALLLSACKNGKPAEEVAAEDEVKDSTEVVSEESSVVYNETDARMHGLLGKVKSVTTIEYSTYEVDGQIKEGNENRRLELLFDEWGHVIKDQWNNEYGYDADGNFYRGNHTYTKVVRDKQGRIVKYIDEKPNTDDANGCTYTFAYSKHGQLISAKVSSWCGQSDEVLTYSGKSLFPASSTKDSCYEGDEGSYLTNINYKYSSKDEQGNWTDRTRVVEEKFTTTIYDAENEQTQEKTETSTTIFIEKRVIEYF